MKMKAAVLVGPARMEIQEVELTRTHTHPGARPDQGLRALPQRTGPIPGQGNDVAGRAAHLSAQMWATNRQVSSKRWEAPLQGFKPGDRVTGIGFKKSFAEYATIDLASKELVTGIVKVPDGIPLELLHQ